MMTEEQRTTLNELRKEAIKKPYYEHVYLQEREIAFLLVKLFPEIKCVALPELLKNDLLHTSNAVAVGMWCDTEFGLCINYPQEIIKISRHLMEYAPSISY